MKASMEARLPFDWRNERGVFVPGLMGAGILVSIAMLIGDTVRRILPASHRRLGLRVDAAARGRVDDLLSIQDRRSPVAHAADRIPRSWPWAVTLGSMSIGGAAVVAIAAWTIYLESTGVLSDRGWTLTVGFGIAAVAGAAGMVWIGDAALGRRSPRPLRRLAAWGPLGRLPDPDHTAGKPVRRWVAVPPPTDLHVTDRHATDRHDRRDQP